MIVKCPKCQARYSLEASALGYEGKKLRCSQCKNMWFQKPPADLPHQINEAANESGAEEIVKKPKRKFNFNLNINYGWVGFLAFVSITLLVFVTARGPLASIFPSLTGVYSSIGLSVAKIGEGFEIVDEKAEQKVEINGKFYFFVKGAIVNLTEEEKSVPAIICTLYDEQDQPIHKFKIRTDAATLKAGKRTPFQGKFENPSLESKTYSLTFTADEHYHPVPEKQDVEHEEGEHTEEKHEEKAVEEHTTETPQGETHDHADEHKPADTQ